MKIHNQLQIYYINYLNKMESYILLLKYLFAKPISFKTILCRLRGHPHGVIWYNANGNEPDMHCRVCGDDLG